MNRTSPIGVFDSGTGGLTVLKELQRLMPREDFVYFADLAHMPYGTKSSDEIKSYAHKTMEFMEQKRVKMAIAACHTSSAIAIDSLVTPFPVIGTVHPMVENFHTLGDRIGIIATPATTMQRFHERALRDAGFEGYVTTIACEQFVPHIESGDFNSEILRNCAQSYLQPFYDEHLTTLVYGCTHYPLIADLIKPLLPSEINCIDPAFFIAQKTLMILNDNRLLNDKAAKGKAEFYASADVSKLVFGVRNTLGYEDSVVLVTDNGIFK